MHATLGGCEVTVGAMRCSDALLHEFLPLCCMHPEFIGDFMSICFFLPDACLTTGRIGGLTEYLISVVLIIVLSIYLFDYPHYMFRLNV